MFVGRHRENIDSKPEVSPLPLLQQSSSSSVVVASAAAVAPLLPGSLRRLHPSSSAFAEAANLNIDWSPSSRNDSLLHWERSVCTATAAATSIGGGTSGSTYDSTSTTTRGVNYRTAAGMEERACVMTTPGATTAAASAVIDHQRQHHHHHQHQHHHHHNQQQQHLTIIRALTPRDAGGGFEPQSSQNHQDKRSLFLKGFGDLNQQIRSIGQRRIHQQPRHQQQHHHHRTPNQTFKFEQTNDTVNNCGQSSPFEICQSPFSNGLDSDNSNTAFDSFDHSTFLLKTDDSYEQHPEQPSVNNPVAATSSSSSPPVDSTNIAICCGNNNNNNAPAVGQDGGACGCSSELNAPPFEELNTRELAQRISLELKRYSIPQAVFAEQVLSRSQGTLSDLLRNPKPWSKLKSGRETFKRMWRWLQEPELTRMSHLCSIATRRKDKRQCPFITKLDSTLENGAASGACMVVERVSAAELMTGSNGDVSEDQRTVTPNRRPRLVFTDIQRRTLHAIFKETKRPSREMQVTIAHQLGLEVSTVSNFFMNARRRSMDKWQDNDSSSNNNSNNHSTNNNKNHLLIKNKSICEDGCDLNICEKKYTPSDLLDTIYCLNNGQSSNFVDLKVNTTQSPSSSSSSPPSSSSSFANNKVSASVSSTANTSTPASLSAGADDEFCGANLLIRNHQVEHKGLDEHSLNEKKHLHHHHQQQQPLRPPHQQQQPHRQRFCVSSSISRLIAQNGTEFGSSNNMFSSSFAAAGCPAYYEEEADVRSAAANEQPEDSRSIGVLEQNDERFDDSQRFHPIADHDDQHSRHFRSVVTTNRVKLDGNDNNDDGGDGDDDDAVESKPPIDAAIKYVQHLIK